MGMRLMFLLFLITTIIYDFEIPLVLHTPTNQMIIAFLVILIILLIDEIIGFLIGIIFLVIYFKYYQKVFNKDVKKAENQQPLLNDYKDSFVGDVKPDTNSRIPKIENDYIKIDEINGCIEMPYISNELLEKAQTNIYDMTNYYNEIKISPDAYGIQGLNADLVHYSAFDKNELINNYV